jgi:hypothetical protein
MASAIPASSIPADYNEPAPSRSRPISEEATAMHNNPSSASSDIKPMTGARSENSVLFSLNNLQALATGGGGGPAGPSQQPKPGYANSQTEGSGLIDIRQMAAQTLSASSFAVGSSSKPDELPLVNDTPMFSPIAPSVLLPSAEPSGMPKWVWGILGLGGVLLVGMVIFIVSMLNSPTPTPPTPGTTGTTGTTGATASGPVAINTPGTKPAATPDKPAAPNPQAQAGDGPGKTSPKEPATAPVNAGGDSGEKKHHHDRDKDKTPKASTKDKDSTPAQVVQPKVEQAPEPVKKPKQAKPKDDLDALLDSASPGGSKPKADTVKKDAPEQLSMDMIKSGLKGVNGSVQACGTPGTYIVKMTIAKSGRVSDASVPGKSGDSAADCVARAVKSARFPEFTGDPQTLSYPFILR